MLVALNKEFAICQSDDSDTLSCLSFGENEQLMANSFIIIQLDISNRLNKGLLCVIMSIIVAFDSVIVMNSNVYCVFFYFNIV